MPVELRVAARGLSDSIHGRLWAHYVHEVGPYKISMIHEVLRTKEKIACTVGGDQQHLLSCAVVCQVALWCRQVIIDPVHVPR
eukprot:1514124-Amphidinium_carterae.1